MKLTNKSHKVYRGKTYYFGGETAFKKQVEGFAQFEKERGYSTFFETIKDHEGTHYLMWTTSKVYYNPGSSAGIVRKMSQEDVRKLLRRESNAD